MSEPDRHQGAGRVPEARPRRFRSAIVSSAATMCRPSSIVACSRQRAPPSRTKARALALVAALERAARAGCFGRAGRDGRHRERRGERAVSRRASRRRPKGRRGRAGVRAVAAASPADAGCSAQFVRTRAPADPQQWRRCADASVARPRRPARKAGRQRASTCRACAAEEVTEPDPQPSAISKSAAPVADDVPAIRGWTAAATAGIAGGFRRRAGGSCACARSRQPEADSSESRRSVVSPAAQPSCHGPHRRSAQHDPSDSRIRRETRPPPDEQADRSDPKAVARRNSRAAPRRQDRRCRSRVAALPRGVSRTSRSPTTISRARTLNCAARARCGLIQAMMERTIEKALFASRWILAPVYLGLSLALVALGIKFFMELFHLLTGRVRAGRGRAGADPARRWSTWCWSAA